MIVSNTSPLVNFYSIERLEILEILFQKIFIPHAVCLEIQEKNTKFRGIESILNLNYIETKQIEDVPFANSLKIDLDDGESESIALAKEMKVNIILLDELSARTYCNYHSLKPLGSIGCLILAKNKGIISRVKPSLDEMIQKGRFWVNPNLYKRIIEQDK